MDQKGKNSRLSAPRSRESLEVQSIILPSSGRHSIMLYTVFIECSLDIQTWLGFWDTQKLKIRPGLLQILVKVKCISFLPLHPDPQSLAVVRGTIATSGILRENHVGYTSAHLQRWSQVKIEKMASKKKSSHEPRKMLEETVKEEGSLFTLGPELKHRLS